MKLYEGMKLVAGPKGKFTHVITIIVVKNNGLVRYSSEGFDEGTWSEQEILKTIEEGYWKPLYELKDYVDEAEKC